MSIEYGVVKEYDLHAEEGVLAVIMNSRETTEELHFFLAGGRLVELKDHIPQFIHERMVEPPRRGFSSRFQRGDLGPVPVGLQLAFERSEHDRNVVEQWSSAHEYRECLRELRGPYYRVIRRNKAKPWIFKVVRKNLTLPELKARYPVESDDPLVGCEIQFWNFSHTRGTRGGSYYACSPGWEACWTDPRI